MKHIYNLKRATQSTLPVVLQGQNQSQERAKHIGTTDRLGMAQFLDDTFEMLVMAMYN
jgi:hypothetical protein